MQYDLIIIGAGPIGLVCAIEAQRAELNYLVLEKGVLVNSIYHFPTNMTFFSTSMLLEIGEIPFISHTDKPTRIEALEYYRRVTTAWNLNIHFQEKVQQVSKQEDGFQIRTLKNKYVSKNIVYATGFHDKEWKLNIPGEELEKVSHYYKDAHPYFRKKLAIIGAGNSACDAALECWQKGAEVSLLIRDSQLKESIKYWIKPNIENRIKEGSIKALFNTRVLEIKEDHILINTSKGNQIIENDAVLALTGYQPDFELLDQISISYHPDEYHTPIYNEHNLQSSVEGVYLAGVVLGGLKTNKWFIETTRDNGKKIINHLLHKQ